jgi:hypothetical protein
VILSGEQVTVQLFFMRLCYSRRVFVMAFPAQKQEAFFEGHVQAFRFFEGIPARISYDNLKTAVLRVLEGHTLLQVPSGVNSGIHGYGIGPAEQLAYYARFHHQRVVNAELTRVPVQQLVIYESTPFLRAPDGVQPLPPLDQARAELVDRLRS